MVNIVSLRKEGTTRKGRNLLRKARPSNWRVSRRKARLETKRTLEGRHDGGEGAAEEDVKPHKEGATGEERKLRTPLICTVVASITAVILENQRSPPRRMGKGRAPAVSVSCTISLRSRKI